MCYNDSGIFVELHGGTDKFRANRGASFYPYFLMKVHENFDIRRV